MGGRPHARANEKSAPRATGGRRIGRATTESASIRALGVSTAQSPPPQASGRSRPPAQGRAAQEGGGALTDRGDTRPSSDPPPPPGRGVS
eukprot:4825544-Pyramimonas_sp.AAC.1